MKKITLLIAIMVFSVKSFAQDKDSPWAVGVGINVVDVAGHSYKEFGQQVKDYFGGSDLNILPVLSRVYVARYLDKGFTLDATGSINSIDKIRTGDVDEKTYYGLDLGLRYDLNKLFGETGWFDPYVKASAGAIWIDDDFAATLSPGIGFNTWFNERLGLNFESSYKNSNLFGDNDTKWGYTQYIGHQHFQHSISLVLKFGKKDADGDGVSDSKDLCPDVPGLKELNGCPDSDGDGVADKEDQCPNEAGKLNGCPDSDGDGVVNKDDKCPNKAGKLNGCPDSDGDGVADNLDQCPNKAGKLNGCPDSDGDGVADNVDKCPEVAGPKSNAGCAVSKDSDGDGVLDNLDNCINERGPRSNNGCPVKLTVEAKRKLGRYAKTIQFNSGKSDFKPGVTRTLDEIVNVMREFDGVRFDVEGHSDSSGNDAKNLALSQRRAQAVVDYLASHGIKGWRLHAVGYGEARPIASNKTAAGRALNRRVVLSAIEK